jgi:thiol:disulfide interchange protein DsbC
MGFGLAVLTASAAATVTLAAVIGSESRQEKQLLAALAKTLPSTRVSAVDCGANAAPKGFCEFVAGRNVFYATPNGRFVLIGQVLDLEKKIDLTERRMREVGAVASAEDLLAGRPPQAGAGTALQPPLATAGRSTPPQILKVDLPAENAVVHNRGARLKMTVFTDFNCHFCRQLFEDLRGAKDIEVTEYPVAFLGADSAAKARSVLCAPDRQAAADALYNGGVVKTAGECADGARRLQQNLDFAQSHGISGTPMIVRSDGATNPGWMPTDKLTAWLGATRG